ncbi:MAG: hypothetical protein IK008_05380 [Bacteroidales bacterium]|nr:hypothetical protein [Bacteroidales bacterium]
MKRTALLAGSILLLLGVLSCVKEEAGPVSGNVRMVTIRVAVPEEPYTKMSFTEEEGKLKTAWEDTDCIRVISGENSAVYNISNIISDHVAEFTGPAVAGSSFDILYPGTYASVAEAVADVTSPTQVGNGSTAHLRFRALLSGVDTYEEIAFKDSWAQTHGGTLKQGAAVKLVATLPSGVTSLTKAGIMLGGENYTVPLSGVDVSASAQKLTAFIMLPWEDIPLPNGTKVSVYALDADNEAYGFQIPISGDKTVMQGKMNSFGGHATALTLSLQDFVAGDGTQGNPYLIANARQLNNMHNSGVLAAGETKYFRLLEDIDASSITNWAPLNAASPFDKAMDFDGDGHSISHLTSTGANYASFTGVLNGLLHDVTFDGATVNHTSKIGVVGGFVGTTNVVGNCTNVHVKNSSVSGSSNWVGGFAAEINTTGTLKGCSVENTSIAANTSHMGGFTAIVRAQNAKLEDCYVKNLTLTYNTTPAAKQGLGGFVGCTTANATFDGCHVDGPMNISATADVTTDQRVYVGGFIGYIASDKPSFEDCYVEGPDVSISGKAETGGFVGFNDKSAGYENCRVTNSSVSGIYHLGGFMGYGGISGGYEVPSIFKECKVQNVSVNQTNTAGSGSIYTGGFAGGVAQALSFIDCEVTGTAVTATQSAMQNVGGFVGCTLYAGSNYQGCTVTGSVTAKANSVGGFVGWAYVPDAYKDCSSAASVTVTGNTQKTGGFVGYASGAAAFTGCSATGDVNTEYVYAGGFVGQAENASFTACHYAGGTLASSASGSSAGCGGFVGFVHTGVSLVGCYVQNASVSVPAGGRTGGFVGQLGYNSTGANDLTVTDCYVQNTSVSGGQYTGGFVGVQYGDISRSYVSGGSATANANSCAGFSAFVNNGNLEYCYTTASVVGGNYKYVAGFATNLYNAHLFNCYSAGSISGTGESLGAFVGICSQQGTNPVAVVDHCIGWNASLPFVATNTVGASFTDNYVGTSGTVSSRASAQSWSADVWDLNGSQPVLTPGSTRIKAIFMGDSITWQWARIKRSDAQSKIIEQTHGALGNTPLPDYMSLSGSTITTYFHPGFFSGNGYIDKGISGQNTTQMRNRFEKDVLALNPRVFVLMGGTNDIAQGVSGDDIYDNIAYMAAQAKAHGIKVILCSVTPNNRDYGAVGRKAQYIEPLNVRIKALADATVGYTYCDYWSALVARNSSDTVVPEDIDHGLKDCYKLYDDLHPGPAAYTVMEGIVKPIIDGLLNSGSGAPVEGNSTITDLEPVIMTDEL